MNLRTFHFFLILLSAILAVGFGGWMLRGYGQDGGAGTLVGAVVSFAVAVGLVVYDRWFLRETRAFK